MDSHPMPDNDIMFAYVFVIDVVCGGSGVVVFCCCFVPCLPFMVRNHNM